MSSTGSSLLQLGALIRKRRKSQHLSQQELADLSGVSRSTISQIEVGQRAGGLPILQKIAGGLGVPFDQMVSLSVASADRTDRCGVSVTVEAAGFHGPVDWWPEIRPDRTVVINSAGRPVALIRPPDQPSQ
jgi:transcriptional regulator with XRE-family HTH domain